MLRETQIVSRVFRLEACDQIAMISYSEGLKVCESNEDERGRFLHFVVTNGATHYAVTLCAILFEYTPSFVLDLDEYNTVELGVCETRLIDDVSVALYKFEEEVIEEAVTVCAEGNYPVGGFGQGGFLCLSSYPTRLWASGPWYWVSCYTGTQWYRRTTTLGGSTYVLPAWQLEVSEEESVLFGVIVFQTALPS